MTDGILSVRTRVNVAKVPNVRANERRHAIIKAKKFQVLRMEGQLRVTGRNGETRKEESNEISCIREVIKDIPVETVTGQCPRDEKRGSDHIYGDRISEKR